MATRYFRIQVTMPAADGLVKDACVNTWHFLHEDYTPLTTPTDTANDMVDQLANFYESIKAIYPLTVANPFVAKVYDLADPEPRVPVLTRNIALSVAPAGEPLPDQVAICLSMIHDVASGENPKRARGRVYLGPIYAGQAASSASQAVVPAATRDMIGNAARDAFHNGLDPADPFVCIFSRKDYGGELALRTASGDLPGSFKKVDRVKIDNRWDIQRRRAEGPTLTTLRPINSIPR